MSSAEEGNQTTNKETQPRVTSNQTINEEVYPVVKDNHAANEELQPIVQGTKAMNKEVQPMLQSTKVINEVKPIIQGNQVLNEEAQPMLPDGTANDSAVQRHRQISLEDKQKIKARLDQKSGTAPIKVEYIDFTKIHLMYGIENIENTAQLPPSDQQAAEGTAENNNSSEPPAKRAKKRNRGQNKKRPFREKRMPAALRLCPRLTVNEPCQYGDKCIFSHDTAKIMQEKPPDLGPACYKFETFGKCERGIMCRFGSAHITADFKNIVDEDKWSRCKDKSVTKNILPKDLQNILRKRKGTYTKTDKYLAGLAKTVKERREKQKNQVSSGQNLGSEKKVLTENGSITSCERLKETTQPEQPDMVSEVASQTSQVPSEQSQVQDVESCNSSNPPNEAVDVLVQPVSQPETNVQNVEPQTSNDQSFTRVSSSSDSGCQGNKTIDQQESSGQCSVVVVDKDNIKLRSCEKKQVDFQDKLYLAPLTTVGNLPFRRICKQYGADITCGEMAICTNLLQAQTSEWALLKRHSSEDIFGIQIAGAFPDTMTRCAELLNNTLDLDFLDINVGCPIDLVYSKGAGCGLMNRATKFEDIVRGMSTVLDIPLTVKMRTGVYDKHLVAEKMVPRIFDWGASVVALHGRTREQRYTRHADWDYIAKCVEAASPYPLLGNGDILSFEDANLFKEKSGVAGVMIARGALIKPWIFTEIKEQRHWDISAQERFEIIRTYVNYGLEHWGSDTEGVSKTRSFLLEWLSFLYRYIPVGILETVPNKINQRPPHYVGRNDLETLMASAHCDDWVKISEMLLGPVPDNFQFLPKHKANSYK